MDAVVSCVVGVEVTLSHGFATMNKKLEQHDTNFVQSFRNWMLSVPGGGCANLSSPLAECDAYSAIRNHGRAESRFPRPTVHHQAFQRRAVLPTGFVPSTTKCQAHPGGRFNSSSSPYLSGQCFGLKQFFAGQPTLRGLNLHTTRENKSFLR